MNLIPFEEQSDVDVYNEDIKEQEKPRNRTPRKNGAKRKQGHLITVLLVLIVFLFGLSMYLAIDTISVATESANKSYDSAKESTSSSVYQKFYDAAEQAYHTKNQTYIDIESVQNTAELEVLQVSDVEYVIQNSEDSSDSVTSWLEVTGTGVFTVDLQQSEFIVDDINNHILIRIPKPTLAPQVYIESVNSLLFEKDGFGNGSISSGETLAQEQRQEAEVKIRKEFASNQRFYTNAENSAKIMVEDLVRSFNVNVDGLTVEVEFMD